MFEKVNTHPSYGMLQFSRCSRSSGISLFGSNIQHKDTIVMRLREGEISRLLNGDYYYAGKEIAEVEMSYTQFAEAITSLNHGSGIPVTLRWLRHTGEIEPCPFVSKKETFEMEFKENLEEANVKANKLLASVKNLFEEKKSLTKKDKEEILSQICQLSNTINGNRDFIYRRFNESVEKTTLEAKGEIEAFMQNRINDLAQQALVENRDDIIEDMKRLEVSAEE